MENFIFLRVILKYATTRNQPQPSTTTHNHPQPSTTTHNYLQPLEKPPTTHPKITQKTYFISHYIYYFLVGLAVCFCQHSVIHLMLRAMIFVS